MWISAVNWLTVPCSPFFEEGNLVGISDIDTRALVRHIRDKGAMNAIISSENTDVAQLQAQLAGIPSMAGLELSSVVSTKEPYYYGDENAKYRLAVLDLGIKRNILNNFAKRDIYMKVFPARTTFAEMESWKLTVMGHLCGNKDLILKKKPSTGRRKVEKMKLRKGFLQRGTIPETEI